MRVLVIGAGPGGLFFSALALLADPSHEVTVIERNAPDDTFGFGVVFSDETLDNLAAADPLAFDEMRRAFVHWDCIEIRRGSERVTSTGHGFAGLSRRRLLEVLQERALDLGADLHFCEELSALPEARNYDLIVAADGANSLVRN